MELNIIKEKALNEFEDTVKTILTTPGFSGVWIKIIHGTENSAVLVSKDDIEMINLDIKDEFDVALNKYASSIKNGTPSPKELIILENYNHNPNKMSLIYDDSSSTYRLHKNGSPTHWYYFYVKHDMYKGGRLLSAQRVKYECRTVKDLRNLAKSRNIKGSSVMKKADLIVALRK
jgi:hypothetical protein